MSSILTYRSLEKSYYLAFNASTLELNPVSHRKSPQAKCPHWEKGTYQIVTAGSLVLQISFDKNHVTYFLRPIMSNGRMSKIKDEFPLDLLEAIKEKHPWIDAWAVNPTKPKAKINAYLPEDFFPANKDQMYVIRRKKLQSFCSNFGITELPLDAFAIDTAMLNYDPLHWANRIALAPEKYREFVNNTPTTKTVIKWYGSDGRGHGAPLNFSPTYYVETEDGMSKVAGTVGLENAQNYRYLVRTEHQVITVNNKETMVGIELTILDSPNFTTNKPKAVLEETPGDLKK